MDVLGDTISVADCLREAKRQLIAQTFGSMHVDRAHCATGILHLVVHNWCEPDAAMCHYGNCDKPYQEVQFHFERPIAIDCPECNLHFTLLTYLLLHMNDHHRWSFEQIAELVA